MDKVGKSYPKYDGLDHVTGQTKFVNDVVIPGTLVCKALKSPVNKGKVKTLDTSKAEKLPGVHGVITSEDVPHNVYDGDKPVLTRDIKYKGELIAAVAAEDKDTAEKAIELIDLEIEEQTAVLDPLEALKKDAPKVKPEGNVHMFGDRDYYLVKQGNIEKGFEEADVIEEHEYYYPPADQSPMETQTSLAVPHPNGKLTVYTTSQCLYTHLPDLCEILQMPFGKVNYVGGTVGGGFGGKNDLHADPVVALLALKTGKPVKWVWTREEELKSSTIRGAWYMRIKDGIRKDGRILAREMVSILDGGAYIGFNPYACEKHASFANGPYHIPNVINKAKCVFTNKQMAAPMRGFAITPCSFASEVQIERDAKAIGMDPFRIRMVNALRKGESVPTGSVPGSICGIEIMQQIAEKTGVELSDDLLKMASEERRSS